MPLSCREIYSRQKLLANTHAKGLFSYIGEKKFSEPSLWYEQPAIYLVTITKSFRQSLVDSTVMN